MERISGVIAKATVFDSPAFKESHTNPFNSFTGLATEEIYPVNIIEPLCHHLFYPYSGSQRKQNNPVDININLGCTYLFMEEPKILFFLFASEKQQQTNYSAPGVKKSKTRYTPQYFSFSGYDANIITSSISDSEAMCPEYKVVACTIRKSKGKYK